MSRRFLIPFVFLLSVAFLSFLQPWGGFLDPDGFYHAKIADLILHGPNPVTQEALHPIGTNIAGLFFLQNFPWLDLTLLHQHFADQHLLYHLALLPFISVFGMLPGTQIAGVTFSSLFITIFYYLLRSARAQNPGLWTLLAAISMPLSFRLSLAKATPFALSAFVLGIWALSSTHTPHRTRYLIAFLAGLLFSLAHGGWVILPISQILFFLGIKLFDRYVDHPSDGRDKSSLCRVIATTIIGIAAGLLIHPNRANLLTFLKVQVLQVAVATPTNISLGLEWGAVEPFAFLANIGPLVIGACITLLGLILAARRPLDIDRARISVGLGVITAALFAFTLKNARMVEYFIPTMSMWLATLWSLVDEKKLFSEIKTQLVTLTPAHPCLISRLLVAILATLLIRDIHGTYQGLRKNAYPFHRFDKIASTLRETAAPGDRIFHDRWDAFGELFASAPEFRYISGVDPTFLLATRPDLALAYEDTVKRVSESVDSSLATPLMIFQRTDKCRAPSKEIIARAERTVLCR